MSLYSRMGGRARTRLGFAVLLLGLSALCLVASQAYTTRAASASGLATFGKTTVGASSGTFLANRKRVKRFVLPEAGSPIKLSIYPASTKTSGQQVLKGIIYSDASGQPQKLLGVSQQLTFHSSNTAGSYDLKFAAPVKLTAGNHSNARGLSSATLGLQTKFGGCRARGVLPDPACTPGAIFAGATVSQICTAGYSKSVRYVPVSLKQSIYAEYGVESHPPGSYEIDHLVSLELGGNNSRANLWPEISPGYHQKDGIENRLHNAVCRGAVSLRAAQREIAHDWRHTFVGAPTLGRPGAPRPEPPANASPPNGTPANFCTTHQCIPSFSEGTGTIVQCADGEWSHSGGHPGVCSGHGGVKE
jgi:hypothetical protein